jgi:hypothetical protein
MHKVSKRAAIPHTVPLAAEDGVADIQCLNNICMTLISQVGQGLNSAIITGLESHGSVTFS